MDMFCADNGAHDTELDGLWGQCPHDADYESERDDEDLSETEISQIKLYDGIKRMVFEFLPVSAITVLTLKTTDCSANANFILIFLGGRQCRNYQEAENRTQKEEEGNYYQRFLALLFSC